jgi:hypothetical protein
MSALEMNPEIRARWVAALRSGEIPQASGILRDGDARCCLGVLCDLAVADGVIPEAAWESREGIWLYGRESQTLPASVSQWAGIEGTFEHNPVVFVEDDDAPGVPVTVNERSLAELNDGGWTFPQIAGAIEGVEAGATS